jgi:hypothetical protein
MIKLQEAGNEFYKKLIDIQKVRLFNKEASFITPFLKKEFRKRYET